MSARNRVFILLGLLTIGSLIWYFVTVHPTSDLQVIGTVDANEVQVSSRIAGRLKTLTVTEGQQVKAGDLIATIESDDLSAGVRAAEATAQSQQGKLGEARETERRTRGETSSATVSSEAQVRVAEASLAQAKAQREHQKADTTRTVALAAQGIVSAQARDESVTSLQASEAAVAQALHSLAAAQANLRESRAHEIATAASVKTVAATRDAAANARALADQARVTQGYAQVFAPVSGRVNVWATRQGEVVSAGTPIVTIMDLTQTWVYAPLPETQSDAVQVGDSLHVVMPSGGTVWGKVINKATEADFATQRDVSSRKRDIKTVQLKLLIDNPGEKYVPGMTAEVYIPKAKLVKP
ncbi:MAG: efflux RND transporter periplasmic adaptor subunit [Terracidiphilus sp.]|nr:efflux RND transporter periplasmic adaptor subunit [Terracidiphilus sp.]